MPLLDYFHAPLYPLFHWESFHSHWPSILTNYLNAGVLPEEYIAAPHVKMGGEVEIDLGTLDLFRGGNGDGGTATAVYTPPPAAMRIPIAFPSLDLFEILIRPEGSARLAAAIEFVGPANKDRPEHRKAFALKCASYLREGAALIVMDIVTTRGAYLPEDILNLLSEPVAIGPERPQSPYAFACRTIVAPDKTANLEVWSERLALGKPLPTMPLWLAPDCVIGVPVRGKLCRDLQDAANPCGVRTAAAIWRETTGPISAFTYGITRRGSPDR